MNHISKQYPDEFNKSNVRKDALRHLANEYHIEETSANRREISTILIESNYK